jgi:hypothetical protein
MLGSKKLTVQKPREFLFSVFAKTKFIWSEGLVTRDFENRIQFGRDIQVLKNFHLDSVCSLAQPTTKSFPRWLSQR